VAFHTHQERNCYVCTLSTYTRNIRRRIAGLGRACGCRKPFRQLEALYSRFVSAWDGRLEPACDRLSRAERQWFRWHKLNPDSTEAEQRELKERINYFGANEEEAAANAEVDGTIEAICKFPALTVKDLIVTARAADKVSLTGGEDIAWSIVSDLLAGTVQS
jgi:hypothetical protein